MGWAGKQKEYSCFVCGSGWKGEHGLLLMREETALSRLCLGEKLQEVVRSSKANEDVVLLFSPRDQACWPCATALNTVDRLEHRLDQLKEDIVQALLKTRTFKHKIPSSAFIQNIPEVATPKESKEYVESKEIKESKENKESKEIKESEENKESKENIENKENKKERKINKPNNTTPTALRVKTGRGEEKIYPCRFCSNVYGNEPALLSHMLVKHPPKYLCHICDSSFSNETRYKGHLALHLAPPTPPPAKPSCPTCKLEHPHPNCTIRSLTCATCRKERYVESDFPTDKLGSFQCKDCALAPLTPVAASRETSKELVISKEEVTSSVTEILEEVQHTTAIEESVKEAIITNDVLLSDRTGQEISHFKCNECGEEFEFFELPTHKCFLDTQNELSTTEGTTEVVKRGRKSCGDGSVLMTSTSNATVTVAVKCRTCDLEFESIGSLREHWRASGHPWQVDTQHDEFNNIIDKTSNTQRTFKVVKQRFEMRAATMESDGNFIEANDSESVKSMFVRVRKNPIESFKCPQCDLTFLNSSLLKNHTDSTGHRKLEDRVIEAIQDPATLPKYQCSKCDLRCSSKTTLLVHKQYHDRSVACSVCGRWVRDSTLLAVHRRRAHRGHRPYQCTKCPKAFSVTAALRSHLNTSHNKTFHHQI